MRHLPSSHVPEPPYWLHPEIVCGVVLIVVLICLDLCGCTARGEHGCSPSEASFQELGGWILDSREQACNASGKSKSTPTAAESLPSTGLTFPDGTMCEPSRLSKATSTVEAASIENGQLSVPPAGMIQLDSGESTLYAVDSPAQTSATSGHERGSTASAADCGVIMRGSFAYFDRDLSSWKTSQRCLFGGSMPFSGTWPRAGSMRSGTVFQRASLVQTTNATGRSLLPTPRAADGLAHKIRSAESVRRMLLKQRRSRPSRLEDAMALMGGTGGIANPQWLLLFMGFPRDWLDHATEQSETPSSPKSPSGLAAESSKQQDYLGIKNSTGRALTITYDGRAISVPDDSVASWKLIGPLPVEGDTVWVEITATDAAGREWRWSQCRCSFLVREGRRYTLVRLVGPLEDRR